MNKLKRIIAVFALGAALLPFAADAEGPYFGGAGLYASRPGYDDVDGSFGGKVFAGYRFAPFPLFIEASYLDTGDADVDRRRDDDETLKLNFSGYTIGAGLFWPLTSYGSGLWVRGAYYGGDTKVKTPDDPASSSHKESTSGGSFAVGADWKFNPWAGVRVEYEDLIEPADLEDDESIGIFSLGVVFDFPIVREPATRRRY